MLFRLKCGEMMVNRGKVIKIDGVELPIAHIAGTQTRYTLVSHSHMGIMMRQGRKRFMQLMCALPLIRYHASIMSWSKKDTEAAEAPHYVWRFSPQGQHPETIPKKRVVVV